MQLIKGWTLLLNMAKLLSWSKVRFGERCFDKTCNGNYSSRLQLLNVWFDIQRIW
jgi:hypothetical protein